MPFRSQISKRNSSVFCYYLLGCMELLDSSLVEAFDAILCISEVLLFFKISNTQVENLICYVCESYYFFVKTSQCLVAIFCLLITVCVFVCLAIHLSVCLCVFSHTSVCLSLSVWSYICVSVCLSLSVWCSFRFLSIYDGYLYIKQALKYRCMLGVKQEI